MIAKMQISVCLMRSAVRGGCCQQAGWCCCCSCCLFRDNGIWEQLRGSVISSWGQERTLLLFSIPLADSWTLLIDLGSKWIQLSSTRKSYGGKVVRGIHQISGSFCPLCCEMCGIYNGYLAAKQVGFFFLLFFALKPRPSFKLRTTTSCSWEIVIHKHRGQSWQLARKQTVTNYNCTKTYAAIRFASTLHGLW